MKEGNGNEERNDVDNSEPSRHETTESADGELLASSESEPLVFPHYSEQFNSHPDKPTVQCPICPQKFFYEGGLRHHLEAHNENRDIPTFQCPECTDRFFYQSGLNHHAEMHERQKRRESGLYSGEENVDTMDKSKPKNNPQKGTKPSKENNSENTAGSKKKQKTINSATDRTEGSESLNSPSNDPNEKSSINSEPIKKTGRGRGRPWKRANLPRRQ